MVERGREIVEEPEIKVFSRDRDERVVRDGCRIGETGSHSPMERARLLSVKGDFVAIPPNLFVHSHK